MYVPFESGHLANGGALGRAKVGLTCTVCKNEFSSYVPRAKSCDKCRPEYNRRKRAANYKKARAKQRAAASGI